MTFERREGILIVIKELAGGKLMQNLIQKNFPYILIIATILFGGFILVQKNIISDVPLLNNSKLVEVKKQSMVDLIFSGKEYKLSYIGLDPANFVNISKFDKNNQWQGDGSIEGGPNKGENSLSLIDRDRKKATSFLYKNLDLAGIDNIKFVVNLKSDPDDLETLNIIFGNKDLTKYYRFPITNMIMGINYFTIPKHRFSLVDEVSEGQTRRSATTPTEKSTIGWDKIERVQLELLSRPTSKANAEVGWIRGEKEEVFTPDWNWDGSEHFFNLDQTADGKIALLAQHVSNRPVTTLRKLGSVNDFTYTVKITAIKKGILGLFFRGDYKTGYGYYLTVGGLRTSDWTIDKFSLVNKEQKTTTFLSGQIGNFEFSQDQPFWLKVITKGSNISAYFSLDGKEYTKLGDVVDNEFGAGGMGIVLNNGGTAYFDDFVIIK